jgi:transposase-like protein
MIQIEHDAAWLWIAIGHVNKTVEGINVAKDWTVLVADAFLKTLIKV